MEYAGEIRLDELAGIPDYKLFCQMSNKEYDPVTDKGVGATFWNSKNSHVECAKRVDMVKHHFEMTYPDMLTSYQEPQCDWWR
jgi:hypothetical protein